MEKMDYKKEYKDLYMPKTKPMLIQVPSIKFIMIDGAGNPNTCEAYKNAMEIMYGLSYGIKMSKMSGNQPKGYFEYVVPPLEGLWWGDNIDFTTMEVTDKDAFCWTSMIRQPEFVTKEVFERAKEGLHKKKPELDLSIAHLIEWEEGLCAQVMHHGIFDDEGPTVRGLEEFIKESGYRTDVSGDRKHHEIYLSDPRKTAPDKLRTVIRHPIAAITK